MPGDSSIQKRLFAFICSNEMLKLLSMCLNHPVDAKVMGAASSYLPRASRAETLDLLKAACRQLVDLSTDNPCKSDKRTC